MSQNYPQQPQNPNQWQQPYSPVPQQQPAYPQPQHPAPYLTGPQFGSAHPGSPFIPQPMVIPPKRINHALHAVLTLFTCGFWLPVWILVGIFSQKKSKLVYPDGRVEYR